MSTWSVLRLAVIGLAITACATLVAVTVLLWADKAAPDGLIAIGATSVGALATLMVQHPPKNGD